MVTKKRIKELKEKILGYFKEHTESRLREVVEHVYGSYDESKKSAVLRDIKDLINEGKVYRKGRGMYVYCELEEWKKKVKEALLQFYAEKMIIVSVESIRTRAEIPNYVPFETVYDIAIKAKDELGLRISIGTITFRKD
jgi:hypothetical protein